MDGDIVVLGTPATSVPLSAVLQEARKSALVHMRRVGHQLGGEVDHYVNQAFVSMLDCARRGAFQASRGGARGYLARAAYFGVKRALTKDRALVQGDESSLLNVVTIRMGPDYGDSFRTTGAEMDQALWCKHVRRELSSEFRDLPRADRDAGIDVLLGEPHVSVAGEREINVRRLYRTTAKMRQRIRNSKRFAALAADFMPQRE